jgi:acyl-CoA reductase-like NAD-dependent aldehyde dehydrogenase
MATARTVQSAVPVRTGEPGTFEVRAPVDGHVLAQLMNTDAEEVAQVATQLRAAQLEWEELGAAGRARHLLRLRDWVLDNESYLLDVIQSESGKVRQDASFETAAGADVIAYFARRAERYLRAKHPLPHGPLTLSKALTVAYRPYPLVGVITPWNFPLFLPLVDCVPALLAGAAVLLKPSEVTPLTGVELGRAWQEIGAPDVLRVVTGGRETGAAVVDEVSYVQFTGSTATGRAIAVRAAERLIPCSLELGGKDAMIVLADADVDRAVGGALWGGFFNSGQVCTSVERVYVEDGVYDEFVSKLVDRAGKLRHGPDGVAGESEVGAMATDAQVGIVASHVDDAVAHGARVATGGSAGKRAGLWFEPTVLLDVDQSMRIMQEETFGPTLPVMRVRDADEAIAQANDSAYGLSATIWTKSRRRGQYLARLVEAGAVNVNDVFANVISPTVPMAGWGNSGVGARFGGAQGLLRFCRTQAITAPRITTPADELLWYPYSLKKSALAARVVRFAVGRGKRRFGSRGVSR